MVDLSHQASLEYWKKYDDPSLWSVIFYMEQAENNTLDNNAKVEEKIKELTSKILSLEGSELSKLDITEPLVMLCSSIKLSRALRLLQALDDISPGMASKVLLDCEERSKETTDMYYLFLQRNLIFERMRLSYRVFDSKHIDKVFSALAGI